MFRQIPKDTRRADDAVLDALESLATSYANFADFQNRCADASICCTGSGGQRRRQRPDADPDNIDNVEAEDDATPWTVHLAVALSKVANQLQKELLDERIINYVTECCATPDQRRADLSHANLTVRTVRH